MKDILTVLGGFLVALLAFFTTVGIKFEWFTIESINAFVVVVGALAALLVNLIAIWRNRDKIGLKDKALKAQGLKKK